MHRVTTALGVALLLCHESVATPSSEQQFTSHAQVTQCLQAAPKPYYSEFEAAHHFRGSGLFILRVHVKTGRVVKVTVAQSTSHPPLDAATVRALSDWRFKPDCLKPTRGTDDTLLRIPVTFALRD
jgi:TonB family protein